MKLWLALTLVLTLAVAVVLGAEYYYDYSRVFNSETGQYDIRLSSPPKSLSIEISSEFPEKHFLIRCVNALCRIIFDTQLSGAEEDTLDTIVANHKEE